jgi:hypothetical protein
MENMGQICTQTFGHDKDPWISSQTPKGFQRVAPHFSGEDLITTEDHLDFFLHALEPYDQHEDILMRLFSYTFFRKGQGMV